MKKDLTTKPGACIELGSLRQKTRGVGSAIEDSLGGRQFETGIRD